MFEFFSKHLMGRGIDKKFPFLVSLYKKAYFLLAKEGLTKLSILSDLNLFVSNKDSGLGLMLRSKGEFEPVQSKLFTRAIKKGDVIFDIGANIGYYTVLASKLVDLKGKVYAFEPDPDNLKLLEKNILLNKCSNVVVVPMAVSERAGTLTFKKDLSNPGESKISEKGNVKVKATTLDKFITSRRIKKIDLIKVDVEGAEINVLKGARTLIGRKDIKMFFECNPKVLRTFGFGVNELLFEAKRLGFRLLQIINERGRKKVGFSPRALKNALRKSSYVSLYAEK